MKYLTAVQAARRIGVSEKTVRMWIDQGKLSAERPAKNRLAIPEPEIERLARDHQRYQSSATPEQMSQQLQEQAAQLASLQDRVTRLESLLSQRATAPTATAITGQQRATRPPETALRALEDDRNRTFPDGSILANVFAEQHNVNPRTFRDQMVKGISGKQAPHSERPKPGRPRETERYLTPEQQELVLDYWRRYNVHYTEDQ